MSPKNNTSLQKSALRRTLRKQRAQLHRCNPSPNLYAHLPPLGSHSPIIAGYAPIGSEIDIWPLLRALQEDGRRIALPVITAPNHPLIFRDWTPSSQMETDGFGVEYPKIGARVTPNLLFVPLLAFTAKGDRLGYGGGFYDRTLARLRANGEVFACGAAYAGQEVDLLPTDRHDAKLDGILTEDGFRAFT